MTNPADEHFNWFKCIYDQLPEHMDEADRVRKAERFASSTVGRMIYSPHGRGVWPAGRYAAEDYKTDNESKAHR